MTESRRVAYIGPASTCPQALGGTGGALLMGFLLVLLLLIFTFINSTNENTTMEANFSFKRLKLMENYLNFLKISQTF